MKWIDEPTTDPQAFAAAWHQERQKQFLARREVVLGRLADRYRDLSQRFDQAMVRLEENKDLWQKWTGEEKQGKRSGVLADLKLKAKVQAGLAATRRLAWSLERVHQRLVQIETRLGVEAFAALPVHPASGDWAGFVSSWHAKRAALEAQLAQVHFRVKLFALRHGGKLDRPKP